MLIKQNPESQHQSNQTIGKFLKSLAEYSKLSILRRSSLLAYERYHICVMNVIKSLNEVKRVFIIS